MPTFVYLRGVPGSGKITVARILQRDLGWRLFWSHDLDNLCEIVGGYTPGSCKLARLLDDVTAPVVRYLLDNNENVIFVRPSRDRETVASIRNSVDQYSNYRFILIELTASYLTLCKRIESRGESKHRLYTSEALNKYLSDRPHVTISGEYTVSTEGLSPEEVSERIKQIINDNESHQRKPDRVQRTRKTSIPRKAHQSSSSSM